MDVYQTALSGVVTIVVGLVLASIASARKNKARFSQIDRAIFGEVETDYPGLIKDVSHLKESKDSTEDIVKDLRDALDDFKDKLSTVKKNQKKSLDEFGEILDIFEKSINKDIPETIRQGFAKEIASMWIQINAKVNKELFESEISHYMTQISDLGGRINSIITTKVNQQ